MRKTVIVLAAVMVLAAVGGYMGYRYWKGTPEYAISQIRESVEQNDIMLFRKYVDLDTLLDRSVDSLLETVTKDTEGEGLANDFARGLAKVLKPTLVSEMKKQIESWVETGRIPEPSEEAEKKESKLGENVKIKKLGRLQYQGTGEERREGKVCYVILKLHDTRYDCEYRPELMMRETPAGHLKVVEIANLAEVLQKMEAEEKAWKARQNAPYQKKMNAALELVRADKSIWQDEWEIQQKIVINLTLKNTSDRAISQIEAELKATPQNKEELSKKWSVSVGGPLRPGTAKTVTWKFDTNQFMEKDMAVFNTPAEDLDIRFKPELVEFTDGDVVELPYRG